MPQNYRLKCRYKFHRLTSGWCRRGRPQYRPPVLPTTENSYYTMSFEKRPENLPQWFVFCTLWLYAHSLLRNLSLLLCKEVFQDRYGTSDKYFPIQSVCEGIFIFFHDVVQYLAGGTFIIGIHSRKEVTFNAKNESCYFKDSAVMLLAR